MDRCTREVRKQYWKNIISQCLQRPKGMSAKQWLDENSICEQTYYYWLKRIRQETYELTTTSNTLPVQTNQNEVTFAEIPFRAVETDKSNNAVSRPDITIQVNSVIFGISNTDSDSLLDKVFEVICHAC